MSFLRSFLPATSLATSFQSNGARPLDMALVHIQASFTGSTCTFTAQIMVSTDGIAWDPYPNSSQTFTEAGSFSWLISGLPSPLVALKVTDTSSGANNGTISANINAKGPV